MKRVGGGAGGFAPPKSQIKEGKTPEAGLRRRAGGVQGKAASAVKLSGKFAPEMKQGPAAGGYKPAGDKTRADLFEYKEYKEYKGLKLSEKQRAGKLLPAVQRGAAAVEGKWMKESAALGTQELKGELKIRKK